MNFKVILLLLIACLFEKFNKPVSVSASEPQTTVSSKKNSSLFGNFFRNIGNKWKKAKKKSAEKKFLEQVQRRNRLEEAAQIKIDKRKKSYEHASKTTWTDLLVVEKWSLKKGYHYWLWRRVREAKAALKKLKEKHEGEEFCDFNENKDQKKKKRRRRKEKKKREIHDVCNMAFKNSYFQDANLTYEGNSPYACQSGKVFVEDILKYPTKFKTCVATKKLKDGSRSQVEVFIKKSDKQRKGGKMKFFVFFAVKNHPDGGYFQMAKDIVAGENTVYKVEAYLKNSWF